MTKWLFAIANTLALSLLILYTAIHIPTFYLGTYSRHYYQYDTAQLIQISEEELMEVTARLVGYIRGTYDDLLITATIAGQERLFFNQREIDHMADVLLLFQIGRILRNISIIVFILTCFWAIKSKYLPLFIKSSFFYNIFVLISCIFLMWIFSTDFIRYFHLFHEIFFFFDQENLWLLNPETDLLINMVPYSFFINISLRIATIYIGLTAIVVVISGVYVIMKRRGFY